MTQPWEELIYTRLIERDQSSQSFLPLMSSLTRLSNSLINILTAPSPTTSSSSPHPSSPLPSTHNTNDAQLIHTRTLLAEQYRIQSTNSQRNLSLTDTLREVENRSRIDREGLSGLRKEVEGLREEKRWFREVVREKEGMVILLQDEHASLNLELNQLGQQNDSLKQDNSDLLRRWIEAKTDEVSKMNEVNTWMNQNQNQNPNRSS